MKQINLKKVSRLMSNSKGFTLTEVLIVMAILALVASFVVGNVMGKFSKAKVDSTKIQIRNLRTILDDFKRECGFYPTTDQGLDALLKKPEFGRECRAYDPDGYIQGKSIPKDGWGNDFVYESDGNTVLITSLGNDGAEGGDGYNADIDSDHLD